MKFEAGKDVFYVEERERRGDGPRIEYFPGWYRVMKVGRKWATLRPVNKLDDRWGEIQVSLNTGRRKSEDFTPFGRAFVDEHAWQEQRTRNDAWNELRKALNQYSFRDRAPDDLDAEVMSSLARQIREAFEKERQNDDD